MKLASYNDGSRDGQLVVVSRDLASAHYATGIATRLQQVLDDWNFLSPQLQALSQNLNHGKARHGFAFDPALCMAPLPRAFAWIDADGDHGFVRGASDRFLAPRDTLDGAAVELDARLAVVVGDTEPDLPAEAAIERVRLVLLAAVAVDRSADAAPGTAFAAVTLTPDELAPGWRGGRLDAELTLQRGGKRLSAVGLREAMGRPFGELIASAAARRGLRAGALVGSGPLGRGEGSSASLAAGELVRLEARGADGQSLFGAIELRGAVPQPEQHEPPGPAAD